MALVSTKSCDFLSKAAKAVAFDYCLAKTLILDLAHLFHPLKGKIGGSEARGDIICFALCLWIKSGFDISKEIGRWLRHLELRLMFLFLLSLFELLFSQNIRRAVKTIGWLLNKNNSLSQSVARNITITTT